MKRILLIEGNTNIRRFIKRELSKGGYSVMETADGLEALIRLKEDKPELLIVDVHTKKKKVLETFRATAVAARHLPVIILKSKLPSEPDVTNWNPASILDRSCKTPELLRAIESLQPARQVEKVEAQDQADKKASSSDLSTEK